MEAETANCHHQETRRGEGEGEGSEKKYKDRKSTRNDRHVYRARPTLIHSLQNSFLRTKVFLRGSLSLSLSLLILLSSAIDDEGEAGPGSTLTSSDERHTKSASSTDKNMTEGGGGKKRLS